MRVTVASPGTFLLVFTSDADKMVFVARPALFLHALSLVYKFHFPRCSPFSLSLFIYESLYVGQTILGTTKSESSEQIKRGEKRLDQNYHSHNALDSCSHPTHKVLTVPA